MSGRQPLGMVASRPDEVRDAGSATVGDVVEFVFEQEFVGRAGAVDQRDVAPVTGKSFEEGTQRCYADAGADEEHLAHLAPAGGEGTVGAFGHDGGAGPE